MTTLAKPELIGDLSAFWLFMAFLVASLILALLACIAEAKWQDKHEELEVQKLNDFTDRIIGK